MSLSSLSSGRAIIGDTVPHGAARFGEGVEQGDRVSFAGQIVSDRQSRGAGAHHRRFLACFGGPFPGTLPGIAPFVHGGPLDGPNGNCVPELLVCAHLFARGKTCVRANRGQGELLPQDADGLIVPTVLNGADVPGDIDPGRACVGTTGNNKLTPNISSVHNEISLLQNFTTISCSSNNTPWPMFAYE